MSTTYGNQFLNGYVLQATAEAAYTVPDEYAKQVVDYGRIENFGSDQEFFTIWMVPKDATNDDQYKAIINEPIAPGQTILLSQIRGESILTGGTIWAEASSADVLSMSIGGANEDT